MHHFLKQLVTSLQSNPFVIQVIFTSKLFLYRSILLNSESYDIVILQPKPRVYQCSVHLMVTKGKVNLLPRVFICEFSVMDGVDLRASSGWFSHASLCCQIDLIPLVFFLTDCYQIWPGFCCWRDSVRMRPSEHPADHSTRVQPT